MTIGRVWRRARQAAFTAEVAASPLARTPDLRHAAVSTWLNGGVPATTVAEWAGHSVEILLTSYAKCLDGGDALVCAELMVDCVACVDLREGLALGGADPPRDK